MTTTICRTCMNESQHYHKLLDKPKENHTIIEMLSSLVPQLHFQADDTSTDLVCETCVEKLIDAYQFQQLCMESNKHFMNPSIPEENVITTSRITNNFELFPRVKMEDYPHVLTTTFDNAQIDKDIKLEVDIDKEVNTEELEIAINAAVDWLHNDDDFSGHEDVLDISNIKAESNLKTRGRKRKETTTNIKKSPTKRSHKQTKFMYKTLKKGDKNGTVEKSNEDDKYESSSTDQMSDSGTPKSHKTNKRNIIKVEKEVFDTGIGEIEKPNSNNRRNGRFPCQECGKIFDRPYRLKRHSSVHSLERPYQCDLCKYRFISESLLKGHKLMHAKGLDRNTQNTPIDGFKCPDCPRRFEKQASMAAHRQTHTRAANIATYPCPSCERKFVNMSSLNEHMNNKHPDVPRHQCNQCEKSFVLHAHLVEHLNRHVGNKNLVCLVCEKEFNYNNALKEHMRIHSGESPYLCPQCGKTFRSGSNLRQHMERHGTEKRYQCTECPSRFSCQSDRIKHMSIHSNTKPHVCDLCGSRFTRAYSLSKHKILHTGQRPFKCEQCSMTFAINYHLRRHLRTHTGEKPYKCKYCERAYAESGDLTKHLRTHVGQNTYMCNECPMAFKYQAELRKHQSDHFKQAQNLLKSLQEKVEVEQDNNVIVEEPVSESCELIATAESTITTEIEIDVKKV